MIQQKTGSNVQLLRKNRGQVERITAARNIKCIHTEVEQSENGKNKTSQAL